MKKVLAIDMGATSIRGILGYIEDGRLVTQEVMRLAHKIIEKDGRMYWQWKELLDTIVNTINENADDIVSVGIDTWGVDFGVLDKEGKLLIDPISYRDAKHIEGYERALEIMGAEDIFLHTGTQIMHINTLFQLIAFAKEYPDIWEKADKVLMMPDLVQYFLSGSMVGEETIWSTSQIMNLKTKKFDEEILSSMNIDRGLLPDLVSAGYVTGSTKNSDIEGLNEHDIKVVSVCGHDTASAVLLTEAFKNPETMFLSCGTWSLFGGLVPEAILTKEAYKYSLTNELGYDSKSMFFKNINGLYLLEKYKKQMEEKIGRKIEFDEITEYVLSSEQESRLVDMEDASFATEDMNAKEAIIAYLQKTSQSVPENDMDFYKIIYDSLVDKYLEIKNTIEAVTGIKYKKLHMIGGGAKSRFLCQMIADRLGLPIVAGPFEASALGNILVQLKEAEEIKDISEGIELALGSEKTNNYEPSK